MSSTGRSRDRSASQPSFGSPLPVPSFAEPGADDEVEDDDPRSGVRAEEEALTEMALRDWAAQKKRDSRSFEDYALVGLDRVGAEAQRDRALRQAIDRQQRMASEIEARRAESAHNFPEAAQPLPSRPRGNANLGRPNITYATSAPGASRTNVARQDAIVSAGRQRAARAAIPKPTGPPMTPAARRALVAEGTASSAPAEAPARATAKKVPAKKVPAAKVPAKKVPAKKVPAAKAPAAKAKKLPVKRAPATGVPAKKAAAPPPEPTPEPTPEPPRLLTPAARRALAAEAAAAAEQAAASAAVVAETPATRTPARWTPPVMKVPASVV
ncbi:MAG: hypothetical protein ACRD1K_10360, partial [Acidimicrobiales bacterium]